MRKYFLLYVLSILTLTIVYLSVGACERQKVASEEGVVATVGSFTISDKHFENQLKRFYLRTGQAANLNEDFRLGVINARIERYAVVEYAKGNGWSVDADAIYNKAMIERQVYMEEYQRRFVTDRLEVSENDVREVFRRHSSSIRASHLRAGSLHEADSLYQLVKSGRSFEDLAKEVFQSPQLAGSGGDLGYFTLDEMDIAFEDAAFSMNIGEISKPVKTSTGYSIIKVTDIITNPLITEFQFAQNRQNLEQVARYQRSEVATRNDMQQVLDQLEWNNEVVGLLWNAISQNLNAYQTSQVEFVELPLGFSDADRNKVVARHRGFRFTVQDFLTEAYYTPVERRRTVKNRHDFSEQLEGLVFRKYALGLIQNHPALDLDFINGTIEETFYSYLFSRFEEDIDRNVHVSDQLVRFVFNSDPEMFQQPLKLDMSEIVFTDGELAGEVLEKLKAGARFETMLERYGAEIESKRYGGHIGNRSITEFGLLSTGLRNVRPGEYAGPFQVATNYYVILKCNSRTEPRPLSFEEAEENVRKHVFATERQRIREQKIQELRTLYNARVDMTRLNSISFQM